MSPMQSRTISASRMENSYPPRLAIDFGERDSGADVTLDNPA
jgi:hypothetical protein